MTCSLNSDWAIEFTWLVTLTFPNGVGLLRYWVRIPAGFFRSLRFVIHTAVLLVHVATLVSHLTGVSYEKVRILTIWVYKDMGIRGFEDLKNEDLRTWGIGDLRLEDLRAWEPEDLRILGVIRGPYCLWSKNQSTTPGLKVYASLEY